MNKIHPTAIVSPKSKIGVNNTIGAYTIIHDNVEIGNNNFIDSHVSIGSNGEIRGCKEFNGRVKIGNNNTIKEFVTIQIGEQGYTIVGSDCMLMSKSHLGHDVKLGNDITISTGVKVGGHVVIGDYTNIGLNSVIHQRLKIDSYCMVGMGSVVTKNISRFSKVVGNPVRILGINQYLIDKYKINFTIEDFNNDLSKLDSTYLKKYL